MLYVSQLLALAGVWAIVVISPGPDFVATVHYAIAHSRRDGLLVAFGITVSTAIWVIVSVVGLGILFARFSWLVEAIRMVGACYLIYLGGRMIWKTRNRIGLASNENAVVRRASAWRVGFLTDISNPKAAAFFGSLFAVFLPAQSPFWLQATSVMIVITISAVWYGLVACLFSLEPVACVYQRMRKWIDYVTGGVLVALGVRLAIAK